MLDDRYLIQDTRYWMPDSDQQIPASFLTSIQKPVTSICALIY